MVEVAICSDDLVFLKRIAALLRDFTKRKRIKYNLTLFHSTQEIISSNLKKFDIFFLDVNMPKINGIEIGIRIRECRNTSIIIYTSDIPHYALDAYSVHPFHYLLKEKLEASFDQCMNEMIHYLPFCNIYLLPTEDGILKVTLSDIQFFEVRDHSIIVHMVHSNPSGLRFCGNLSKLESQLSNIGFLRIHKSYLVNIKHLSYIQKGTAILDSGKVLPCSRQRKKNILHRFLLWTDDEKDDNHE